MTQTIGKGPVLLLGAVCFALLGGLSKCSDAAKWHWGVLVFYVCMGVGRAVYESTNKAIFADFFPDPDKSPGVFANVFVFSNGASATAFILGALDKTDVELYILLVFAALTFPGFLLANALVQRAEARGQSSNLIELSQQDTRAQTSMSARR